jgi:hypothetical protein
VASAVPARASVAVSAKTKLSDPYVTLKLLK